MDETAAFQEFISRHVVLDPERNVQRMLLWTERVRFYLRKSRHFPQSVLEKKFNELILSEFKVIIENDTALGPVYRGLKFSA